MGHWIVTLNANLKLTTNTNYHDLSVISSHVGNLWPFEACEDNGHELRANSC